MAILVLANVDSASRFHRRSVGQMGMGCRVVGASTVIERAPTVVGSEVNINTYSSVLSTVSIESIGAAVSGFSI